MLYSYILMLPVTVVIYWLVTFLNQPKEKLRIQAVFIAFMVLILLMDIFSASIISGQPINRIHYILDYIDSFVAPLIPTVGYLHLKRMTVNSKFGLMELHLFLPAVVLGFGNLYFGLQMGYEGFEQHFVNGGVVPPLDWTNPTSEQLRWFFNNTLFTWLLVIQLFSLLTMAIIYLKRYRTRLENFYANVEDKSYHNLKNFLVWVIIWVMLAMLLVILQRHFFAEHQLLAVIYTLVFTTVQCAVCYNNFKVEFTYKDLDADEAINLEDETSEDLEEETVATVDEKTPVPTNYNRVERILDAWANRADKPYLADGLTLAMVAKECGLRQRSISSYLNSVLHVNFNVWINGFRIEESKRLLLDPKNYTMVDIATRCGMNDAAAFTRLFKRHTGLTPSEFRKKNKSIITKNFF